MRNVKKITSKKYKVLVSFLNLKTKSYLVGQIKSVPDLVGPIKSGTTGSDHKLENISFFVKDFD